MTKIGKLRCGCDCKNATREVPVESEPFGTGTGSSQRWLHFPCCNGTPAPIRYAIIFECFNPWPMWNPGSTASYCAEYNIGGVPVLPACVRLNCRRTAPFPGGTCESCLAPPGLSLTFPVTEVRKACVFDWFDDACSYWQSLHYDYLLPETIDTYMDDSALYDMRPDAVADKFPPYRIQPGTGSNAGEIIEYGSAWFGTADVGYADKTPSILWYMDIDAEPVYLEWWYDCALAQMNGGAGKARPRYEAIRTWERFGRNTMVLTNPEDWPSLRPKICVVPAAGRHISPCNTQEAMCGCCDPGNDVSIWAVTINGCLNGTHIVIGHRKRRASEVPCGIEFPANAPCGAWEILFSVDNECEGGTGTAWGSQIYELVWCTGPGQYQGDVYCFDTEAGCWSKKGSISVSSFQCIKGCKAFDQYGNEIPYEPTEDQAFVFCCDFVVVFTIGEIPCCCSGLPPCSCAPTGTPDPPLYIDVESSSCGPAFETTSTVIAPRTLDASCWEASGAGSGGMPPAIDIIRICCSGDVWTCTLTLVPAGCGSPTTVAASGTCDPFSVTFVFNLPASGCCEPSGGTVTVRVME